MTRYLKSPTTWLVIVLATAFVLIGLAVYKPAHAADKGKAPPVSRAEAEKIAPTSPWTAFYAGGSLGAVAGVHDAGYGLDGWQYGGIAGVDMQINQIVIGARVTHDRKKVEFGGTSIDANATAFGGRAGVLVAPSALAYGCVDRVQKLKIDGVGDTSGLKVCGGIEALMRNDVSVALEYGRATYEDLSDAREHTFTLRGVYRFQAPGINR